LLLVIFYFLTFVSNAKAGPKIAVELDHSGKDIVGQRLAYSIKEKIRQSNALRLTVAKEPRYIISIITLANSESYSTSYSLEWILCLHTNNQSPMKYFITHNAGICGANRVKEVAEQIVAETDDIISNDLKILGGISK
jgi:CMP-2-keto-3-deoxyoctulosonic acid synthetase